VILAAGVLAGTALAVAGSATANPSQSPAGASCNLATLHGRYLFAGDGWSVSGGTTVPLAFAGTEQFDGAGAVRGTSTSSFNGVITSHSAFTGSYTVASDCTGTLSIGGALHFDIYLDPSGDSFAYVQTDPGSVSATTEHHAIRS